MNHLIIFAHPNSARSFGRSIANRIEQISQENGVNVFFRDLYEMDFNPILSHEELQNAIERHYRFGDLFILDHIEEPKKTSGIGTEREDRTSDEESEDNNIQKITVNDLGEAKNYLADTLGISRTSLRSLKSILEVAKANNIEFEGLDK